MKKKFSLEEKQKEFINKDIEEETTSLTNLSNDELNEFENAIKEAIQLQLEEESRDVPDSVLDKARNAMREEKEKEQIYIKTHIVSDSVLDQTTRLMKNKTEIPTHILNASHRSLIKIIFTTMVAILIVLPTVILFYTNSRDSVYGTSFTYTVEEYSSLERKEISSIRDYAKENDLQFLWLEDLQITESWAFYKEDKLILVEEHYLFNDEECILYLMNPNTQIELPNFPTHGLTTGYKKPDGSIVFYTITQDKFYGLIYNNYKVYLEFSTIDFEQINQLLGLIQSNHI